MSYAEVVMPTGPKAKQAKAMISFRCPPEIIEWLETKEDSLADPPVTFTDAAVWALALARDYASATKEFDTRLRALQGATDLTDAGLMRRIIERGITELETEIRAARKAAR